MGDRTFVTLYVPQCYSGVIKELDTSYYDCMQDHLMDDVLIACFYYSEVNYGDLDFLGELRDRGIPYSSEWEAGHNYGGGNSHLRFTHDGEPIQKEIYTHNRNPDLRELLKRINQPTELRKYILDYQEKIEVLPWYRQVEFGKRYLARRLIQPNPT